jgi:outer membrane immunogenic protein
MKKLFLGSAALVVLVAGGSAMAADLRIKTPAPVVSVYNWTGLYIGVHGGGDWFTKDWFAPETPTNHGGCYLVVRCDVSVGGHTASSWLAGGQVGFNYQVSRWVFGVEAQISATSLEGSNAQPTFPFGFVITNHTKTDSLETAAVRLGFTWDRLLVYAKGGGAWAQDQFWTSIPGLPVGQTRSETRGGGMVGVGIEYAFLQNWSVKLEYDHLDLGNRRERLLPTIAPIQPFEYDVRQTIDLVKVGINYRFNWAGPVVAKY